MTDVQTTPTAGPGPSSILDKLLARVDAFPPWVVMVQLFIGIGWTRAASEKIISPQWWSGEELATFLIEQDDLFVGWYRPVVDNIISPAGVAVAIVVLALQLFVGAGFLLGRWQGAVLLLGVLMNLNFVAAGAVNPSAFYLACQGALVLRLVETSTERLTASWIYVVGAFGVVIALASFPFVGTVHPMGVIEDAAAVLVYAGGLTVVACALAVRAILRAPDDQNVVPTS